MNRQIDTEMASKDVFITYYVLGTEAITKTFPLAYNQHNCLLVYYYSNFNTYHGFGHQTEAQ